MSPTISLRLSCSGLRQSDARCCDYLLPGSAPLQPPRPPVLEFSAATRGGARPGLGARVAEDPPPRRPWDRVQHRVGAVVCHSQFFMRTMLRGSLLLKQANRQGQSSEPVRPAVTLQLGGEVEAGVSGRPGGALGLSWDTTHLFSGCWPCLPHQPQSVMYFVWRLLPRGALLPIPPARLPQP